MASSGLKYGTSIQKRPLGSLSPVHRDKYHILDIEMDNDTMDACSSGFCDLQHREIQLYKYNEVPDFLKGNPYVVQGYRSKLPFTQCLKSLFVWSNETLNIWTHLLGFFLFLFLMLYDNLIAIPVFNGDAADHLIVSLGLICYQFCMLCSTGFHVFGCHSEKASKRWLAVDLTGISVGLIGCYLPAVHYAFYCLSIWRDIYLLTIAVLSGSVLFIQLQPHYFSSTWFKQRIFIYIALVAYGIIPTTHWIYLNGGLSSKIVQLFIPKVTTMYLFGMLAFAFYITKFPERMFPGTFDYIGSSHQCWHVIVVIAFLWWHASGSDMLLYRHSNQCTPGT